MINFGGLRPPPPVEVLALSNLAQSLRAMSGHTERRVAGEEVARALVPAHLWREPSYFQRSFWGWLDGIGDTAPDPYVAIWFRGSGKSTCAEMAVVTLGANRLRGYVLYISRTQPRADDHVQNIASMLESDVVANRWPELSTRALGKYGNVKGWRRNRLVTHGGLVVDALGLEVASRGLKIEFRRPDAAVLDDIDHHGDSTLEITKRLETISRGVLPALTSNAVICISQNLVHPDGVVAQIRDGRADFLQGAIMDGPIPAIGNFKVVTRPKSRENNELERLPSGEPTWREGFGAQSILAEWRRIGETSFRREMQHEVHSREGAMFADVSFRRVHQEKVPPLVGRELWIDPAVGAGPTGSLCGFIAGGRGVGDDGKVRLYIEWAHEKRMSPEAALRLAAAKAQELGIRTIGVETDQGGETWRPLARLVFSDYAVSMEEESKKTEVSLETSLPPGEPPNPPAVVDSPRKDTIAFLSAKAGSTGNSKYERWLRLLAGYERDEVRLVDGPWCVTLEQALLRLPDREPFDLADVNFWLWWSLIDKRRGGWRML